MIVYTANHGNKDFEVPTNIYDLEHPQRPNLDLSEIEFVYFSDRKRSIPGWNVVVDKKRSEKTELMRSKWFKIHSHILFPNDVSLYVDANRGLRLRPDEVFSITTNDKPVTLFKHYRGNLFDEFNVCKRRVGLREPFRQMRFAYADLGFDVQNSPVYHGNTIVRHPNAKQFNQLWWRHIKKYCPRDQLSLPFVVWKMAEAVNVRGGDQELDFPSFKAVFHMDSTRRYGEQGEGPNHVPNHVRYLHGKHPAGTKKKKVLFIVGTRPEAIKLAPVIIKAKERGLDARVLTSGQHPEMATDMLSEFDIEADEQCHSKDSDTASIIQRIQPIVHRVGAKIVVVQGDTNTAVAGAMAGFYDKTPVAHVEAGLRTEDLLSPFPEEGNRRMISAITTYHFAPTLEARKNLPQMCSYVTGNTGVDALRSKESEAIKPNLKGEQRYVLLTLHRRESWGEKALEILKVIQAMAEKLDLNIVFPVHPSPAMASVAKTLKSKRFKLYPPLSYLEMIGMMKRCGLILTDSGGIQEEASALNKPYIVLREKTERPEGIGVKGLLAYSPGDIQAAMKLLLTEKQPYREFEENANPFGDGHAAERIVTTLYYRAQLS